jgi:hypothetical protein
LPTIGPKCRITVTSTESTGKEELLSYIDEVNQEVLRIIVSFRSVLNQEKTKYA